MAEKNLYPSDQADKVLVRMPDGMRDRLKEAAKANNRTMNAEIVARLQESFHVKGAGVAVMRMEAEGALQPSPSADEIATEVVKKLDRMIPVGTEALEKYLELIEQSSMERHRKWWMEQFGYDPKAPPVPQHGGPPSRSQNAKISVKKTTPTKPK